MSDDTRAGGVEGTPGLVHHQFDVCGGPMSVYEAGPAGAPIAVMLHGAMYDEARFSWDQLFPRLSSDYHVFAVDTPRHGKSRPWDGWMDRERLLQILHGTLAHLGLRRFSLVGLSMGGGMAIEYAASFPESVVSMALFEPGGLGDKVDWQFLTWLYIHTPGLLRYLGKRYIKKDRASMIKVLESLYVGGTKPVDPDRLAGILEDEVGGKVRNKEQDLDDWQISGIGPFGVRWSLLDRLPLVQCPTLWLRGADSVLVKQHEIERAVALTRSGGADANIKLVDNAGHMLPLEQPAQAYAAVKEFLDQTFGAQPLS